jgi:hypothetical protein
MTEFVITVPPGGISNIELQKLKLRPTAFSAESLVKLYTKTQMAAMLVYDNMELNLEALLGNKNTFFLNYTACVSY